MMGSALKYCAIAEGLAEITVSLGGLSDWDVAAPQLIIEEAGGSVLSYPNLLRPVYNLLNPKLGAIIATSPGFILTRN